MRFRRRCTATFRPPMLLKVWEVNVRQRTDQIDVFTTESSCLAIVWATIQDEQVPATVSFYTNGDNSPSVSVQRLLTASSAPPSSLARYLMGGSFVWCG